MNKLLRTVAFAAAATLTFTSAGVAHAAPQDPAPLTEQQIAAMPSARQAALLNPLRTVANALDAVGRSTGRGVYSGVELDVVNRTVTAYLVDTGQADAFLAAARKQDANADLTLVRVRAGKYTREALHAARDRIAARLDTLPGTVQNAIVPADGSALVLGVEQTAVAAGSTALGDVAGVDVRVTQGHPLTGTDRFGDTPPFYAGAYIVDSGWSCTTGIPVKDGSGNQFMVTASHCGHTGTHWQTGRGVAVGNVVRFNEGWDASLIAAQSAAWEWDGSNPEFTVRLNATRYSFTGDLVCHDGYPSRVVCGIRVDNEDAQNFHVRGPRYGNTFSARGVIGHQVDGGRASQGGDSGGLVFAINSSSTREVRGIVSADVDGTNGNSMFWTEALDIYNAFGVHLTDR